MKTTSLAAALGAALALAALPAAADARTTGSDLSRAATTTLSCTAACTLAWGADGWFDVQLPEGEIVTSWTADLAPGTTARLRLVRHDGDGTSTALGATEAVTGSAAGGVQTFKTHLAVPARDARIAVDLQSGGIRAVNDDSYGVRHFEPALGDAETRAGTRTGEELRLSVTTEGDFDRDGKGDETEDDCVACSPTTPSTPSTPAAPSTPPASDPGTPASPAARHALLVDTRALLRAGAEGRRGLVDVYVVNDSAKAFDATFVVKAGGKKVGSGSVKDLEADSHVVVGVKLARTQLRTLQKRGSVKLTLEGTAKLANGATDAIAQPLTVVKGGDARYDGTWRGPGQFTLVVERGTIRTVTASVLGYCPDSSSQLSMNVFTSNGAPAIVKHDGSFEMVNGRAVSQENTYRGKLSLKGTGKGYASAYKVRMNMSGSRMYLEGCTGATNWTVKRVKR